MGEEGSFLKLYLRLVHAILVSVQPYSFDSKKGSMNLWRLLEFFIYFGTLIFIDEKRRLGSFFTLFSVLFNPTYWINFVISSDFLQKKKIEDDR